MPIDTGPRKGMWGRIGQGALQGLRRNPSLGGLAGGAIGGMFRHNPVGIPSSNPVGIPSSNPVMPPSFSPPNPMMMGTPSFGQLNPMMGRVGMNNGMQSPMTGGMGVNQPGQEGISPMWQNYNRMRQPQMY